ncbi:MAG: ABC transporter ATP-binding protein [Bacilli bacterium]
MKRMIELQNIEKIYDEQTVIPTLNLDILEGEFLTIVGPSGCGKTTLLRMIAGFETPTSGSILLDTENIVTQAPHQRDMNLVFQHYALFPHMNVEKNITFGLRMKGVANEEQTTRLEEVLRMTELTQLRSRKPRQLSGGQQQRVAIARAIINNPKVLLLDEPLGALDAKLRKTLQRELKQLQKNLGITFIYVTHDQEEAMTMSDRIVVMNNGVIEQVGSPEEIYAKPATHFVATFMGENNVFVQNNTMIAVRPESISIVSVTSSTKVTATIVDIEFLGSVSKVYAKVAEDDQTVIVHIANGERSTLSIGQEVGLDWNANEEVRLG